MILNNSVCYLSGSMEYCPEGGKQWRNKVKDLCRENNLNIVFLDPTNKPKTLTKEKPDTYRKMRENGEWSKLVKYMKKIRHDDLRMVDLSDLLIVKIDSSIHASGTYDELYVAERQQKPILVISEGGKEKLPGWLFAVIKLEEIFSTAEECVEYLAGLNNKTIETDERWVFMRDYLNQLEKINA